ncbi:L-ribulose-5-phosphate 3-epimerase [Ligilactobacillus ceti]|uniref:L-ribulose-5-phosphate 3-epimerase n=1 Tax=Ligilactobacillus ceti DSM 22408 TaxID=1122146 RepID=A0A0R2KVR3_9LACO|nr:L-ribulose-5-phosphate 3-epimerase [Ligilactobacillus ceti]KRN90349.1 L-xylulose 5-phosphate 3-epimerase [Ligilactobacillus ceti DSM 22408]
MVSLGIYEKALPRDISWKERLELTKELGFDFLEFSIDESDERLARLEWTDEQIAELRDAIWETNVPIYTMMLSGHRRYPLGSKDAKIREKSLEMFEKAVNLASKLGIRNIQMAGYDVFYEEKDVLTRELYKENLRKCVELAASKQVTLAIETMDDPFINSLAKVQRYKDEIKSPWLQAYPDLGNMSAWLGDGIIDDIEQHVDIIAAIHLKDTLPVTATSKGKFKNVPFGEGCVDFKGLLYMLKKLNYQGTFTVEIWSQENFDDPIPDVKAAKAFFDEIFQEVY